MGAVAEQVLDDGNKFLVGLSVNGNIRVMRMPIGTLDRADALNLAAWLVALADPGQEEFPGILEAVKSI